MDKIINLLGDVVTGHNETLDNLIYGFKLLSQVCEDQQKEIDELKDIINTLKKEP